MEPAQVVAVMRQMYEKLSANVVVRLDEHRTIGSALTALDAMVAAIGDSSGELGPDPR